MPVPPGDGLYIAHDIGERDGAPVPAVVGVSAERGQQKALGPPRIDDLHYRPDRTRLRNGIGLGGRRLGA